MVLFYRNESGQYSNMAPLRLVIKLKSCSAFEWSETRMVSKGGTMDLSCGVSAVRQEPEITWSGGDYTNLVSTEFV